MLTHSMFLLKSFPAITLLPTMKILHEIHLHHHLHHYHHPYPSSSCPLVEEWSGSSEYSLPENILAGQCSQVSTINLQNGAVFKTHFLIHNSKLLHTLPSDSSQLPRNFSVNKLFFQSNSVFPSLGTLEEGEVSLTHVPTKPVRVSAIHNIQSNTHGMHALCCILPQCGCYI